MYRINLKASQLGALLGCVNPTVQSRELHALYVNAGLISRRPPISDTKKHTQPNIDVSHLHAGQFRDKCRIARQQLCGDEDYMLVNDNYAYASFVSKHSCLYGKWGERKFLKYFTSVHPTGPPITNQQQEYFKMLHKVPSIDIFFGLVGRVDGIRDDNEVIEVKFRRFEIQEELSMRDLIQVHVYMWLSETQRAAVYQCMSTTGDDLYIEKQTVIFDTLLWRKIEQGIQRCFSFTEELFGNPMTQQMFKALSVDEQHRTIEQYFKYQIINA